MLNRADLIGYLGDDPTIATTNTDRAVCNFSVATTERWTAGGEKKEKTEWHRVVAWGRLAEICGAHLRKGRLVHVSGRLETTPWERDGITVHSTRVIASTVTFLAAGSGKKG